MISKNDYTTLPLVRTNIELILSFKRKKPHLGIYDEDFILLNGYKYLTVFLFQFHLGLSTMQELSYLGKITLVSIWFRML
jgi:hypothetical protein